MTPVLLTILTFGAVALAIGGIYSIVADLYLRDKAHVSRRLDEEFLHRQRDRINKSTLFKDLSKVAAEVSADEEGQLSLQRRWEAWVEQSGLNLTLRRLVAISLLAGLGFGLAIGAWQRSLVLGIGVVPFAAIGPYLYVYLMRKKRLDALLSQLPDAFDLMSRVIRAGQTIGQAMLAVAEEIPPPLAAEFAYCYEQQNLGLSPQIAYRDLAARNGLLELKIFVVAMLVQQQTGGNMSELLEGLATVVRERFKVKGKIKALTAEGRLQALILLMLPPAMLAMLTVVNRPYAQVLFDHPILLVIAMISMAIGAYWIRKIVNFDV
jgi:tight adherence protein B